MQSRNLAFADRVNLCRIHVERRVFDDLRPIEGFAVGEVLSCDRQARSGNVGAIPEVEQFDEGGLNALVNGPNRLRA